MIYRFNAIIYIYAILDSILFHESVDNIKTNISMLSLNKILEFFLSSLFHRVVLACIRCMRV